MLSCVEKQSIVDSTKGLILASGESVEILRPNVSGSGDFAGPHESQAQLIGIVPIEFKLLSPEDLKQIGADAICSMLPDSDIAENDIVVFSKNRFRITHLKPENCFGTVTHLTVKLEREYQKKS